MSALILLGAGLGQGHPQYKLALRGSVARFCLWGDHKEALLYWTPGTPSRVGALRFIELSGYEDCCRRSPFEAPTCSERLNSEGLSREGQQDTFPNLNAGFRDRSDDELWLSKGVESHRIKSLLPSAERRAADRDGLRGRN